MGAIFAMLSLITAGSGVKPRHELKPIRAVERVTLGAAFAAIFAIHFCGVLWAYPTVWNAGIGAMSDSEHRKDDRSRTLH